MIKFGEWLPDFADNENPGANEAKNVIPAVDGYDPLPAHAPVSNALDSICLGGISAVASDGVIYNYSGSLKTLYELRQEVWTARLDHYYSATPGVLTLTGIAADVVFS